MPHLIRTALLALSGAAVAGLAHAEPSAPTLPTSIVLTLKGHRFEPAKVAVPAGQRIRVQVVNQDSTGDEFESEDLKVEQEVGPHGRIAFQVGPLKPGTYAFKGDLYPATATGVLTAVAQ